MTGPTFSTHPTPVGEVLMVHTSEGLVALEVLHRPLDVAIADISLALHAQPVHDERPATELTAWLDGYFDGGSDPCRLALDWRLTDGFTREALQAVGDIPYGETASYGEVAVMAGRPRAHRAVGTACRLSPFSIVVPVHRVVRADGSIGDYGGHPEIKQQLIDLERSRAGASV